MASNELGAELQAPRRSSRISGQAKVETPALAKKPRKPSKAGTKRAAEEVDKDEKNKKVRHLKPSSLILTVVHSRPKLMKTKRLKEDDDVADTAPIDVGDILPSMTLKNETGEDIDTGSIAAEKGVVLFLVPKADTPGCTTQACGFRDIWQEFTSLDYDVYGVSADSSTAQSKWQTKKELPFPLISDPKRSLIGILGAGDGNKTKRSHFVFEKGGKLLDKKMPVKPADSPRLALEFIKGLGLSE
ncbi:thioredoxin-like protein [Suillus subalutaceus]|uniref:thioredoxin-like protein n=1 Tax=Suillus subalutaceus TaxID=48586 RepID=UPI001B86825F|nr:thioredoxin-like protein [Suillus subalutaceus]KAG1863170.1 thioredoxin-like protein [Suillus subalutaceus]